MVATGSGSLNYASVLSKFKCTTSPSPIECLRKVSATDIKAFIESESLSFPPVNGDGTSIADVRSSIATGKFAKVPIYMGTTTNEARVFFAAAGVVDGQTALDAVFDMLQINSTALQNSVIASYAADSIDDRLVLADRYVTSALPISQSKQCF